MTKKAAQAIYVRFRKRHGGNPTGEATLQPDGSWLFIETEEMPPNGRYVGVVVRADKMAFGFFGALGKVFRKWRPQLGLPTSNERILGATALGRYQAFDNGVANWIGGGIDMAFPIPESMVRLPRQLCVVAFFDLRGFTSWSSQSKTRPNDVQIAIRAFEDAVHVGFPIHTAHLTRQFIKGTGDGVMIVSQSDWYDDDGSNTPLTHFKPGHGKHFFHACNRTLSAGRKNLTKLNFPLAVGCGISVGELDRVFLFGRLDFIGNAANEAAKLQQFAWNEICVTQDFFEILKQDGQNINGATELPSKGWRMPSGAARLPASRGE